MSVLCWCREVMKNKWYFWGICTFLAYLFLGQLLTFTPYIVTQILIISDALSSQNVALLTSWERDSTNQISSWGVYEQFRPILLILRFHFYTVSTFQSLYLLTFTPMRTLNKYYFSLFFPHKYLFFHFTKECVWFFHLWFLSFDTISRVQSFAILEKKRCKKKKW